MTTARDRLATIAGLVRSYRERLSFTQRDVAASAGCEVTRIAHAEQGVSVPPAETLRRVADAVEATGAETIELLALAVFTRRRPVVCVEGLSQKDVRRVVRLVEHLRRRSGFAGACAKCNAGATSPCADGCPNKRGVRHG